MSGYNISDPDEREFEGSSGGSLRAMLEEALAENKKLLGKLNEREREQSTSALLKEKGLDPAIAELIPEDQDPSAWVEKYSHLLGVPSNTPDPEPENPVIRVPDDSDPALVAEREALAAMRDSQETGSPAAVVTNDHLEALQKVNTEEDLLALLRANGGLTADN